MPIYGWPRYALANYSPKNHLLFYSFILRYCAHHSFRGSPLFLNYSQLGKYCVHAVLSCVQYKNDVKFLIQTCFSNSCKQSCVLVHVSYELRSPLTRTILLAFVMPLCWRDTTPNCNLPTKEVSQCNYSWELCLLFSDYSPKLEDIYCSLIIPRLINLPKPRPRAACQSESDWSLSGLLQCHIAQPSKKQFDNADVRQRVARMMLKHSQAEIKR